jgi:hypothetical protein
MNERARLRGELDSTRAAYIQACVRFFESQFAKTVEEAIKASPEATKGLGIEKLRQLKAEMNDAIGNLPQIVPKHLNKPELWEHELPEDKLVSETAFNLNWKTGHQKTEGEFGSIMGDVGKILSRYGLAKIGENGAWQQQGEELRYRYWLSAGDEAAAVIKQYKALFSQFVEARLRVLKLETEKQEAIAKDLWDQA